MALCADHLHVVGRRLRFNKYLWAQQYTVIREMIAPACGDEAWTGLMFGKPASNE
jgi:hypothetical protein